MLEILTHYMFRHALRWDLILYQSDVSFLLNVDFAYFAYSHWSGGIISEPWLTDIFLYNKMNAKGLDTNSYKTIVLSIIHVLINTV